MNWSFCARSRATCATNGWSSLEAIDKDELRELVFDAWRMAVPKKLAALSDHDPGS